MAWTAGNRYLTQAEMEGNAREIRAQGRILGWHRNAIAAMCGNMQAESSINPGIWENLTPWAGGYGLVQWTPYTKLSSWAAEQGLTWQDDGPTQLARIAYEAANNLQWFRNAELGIDPPITMQEFLQSNLPVSTLSDYWLWFYEHPADPGPATQQLRQQYSQAWYDFLFPHAGNIPIWLLFKFNEWRWKR